MRLPWVSVRYFTLTNSLWVTLQQSSARAANSLHWSIACEWHPESGFCPVSLDWPTASECACGFPPVTLLTLIPWPTECECHFCHTLPSHLIPWLTESERHCSDFLPLLHLIPWPTGSEWHCSDSLLGTLRPHPMTISLWVTLQWFYAWHSHGTSLALPLACEWHWWLSTRSSHHILSWPIGCEWNCIDLLL